MEVIAIRVTEAQREFLDSKGNRSKFMRELINIAMVGGEINCDKEEGEMDVTLLVEDIFNMEG